MHKIKMKKVILFAAIALLAAGCGPKYVQPELGARKVDILTVEGYQF